MPFGYRRAEVIDARLTGVRANLDSGPLVGHWWRTGGTRSQEFGATRSRFRMFVPPDPNGVLELGGVPTSPNIAKCE